MPKRHWYMEWVARDWLTDPAVSLLKESTRGIWMDALCCMFLQDGCGQLVGTIPDLARLCRTAPNAMKAAIDDLKERNACDVNEGASNAIVTLTNRRMRRLWTDRKSARDRKKRSRDRSSNGDVTPDVTGDVTDESQRSYPNPHPKTSADAEVPPSPRGGRRGDALPGVPDSLNTPAFCEAWIHWQEHRRQIRKKLTPLSVAQQFKQLETLGEARAIDAIQFTIRMGWTGLREEEHRQQAGADDLIPSDAAMIEQTFGGRK